MAVQVAHATQAGGVDSGDGKISKNAWNEAHTVTGLGSAAEADIGDFAPAVHAHVSTDVTDFAEAVRDTMGVALTAGAGIIVTPNDGADTITIASSVVSDAAFGPSWDGATTTAPSNNAVHDALSERPTLGVVIALANNMT